MSVRPLVAAAALLVVALVLAPSAQAASTACPDATSEPKTTTLLKLRESVVCLLNVERVQRGYSPLRKSVLLRRAALRHSRSMVRHRFFSHQGSGGLGFGDRIKRSGYPAGARSWEAGENLAWGAGTMGTPAAIVDSWMASGQHRQNLLDSTFEQIGVGISRGTPSTGRASSGPGANAMVVTADFGLRR